MDIIFNNGNYAEKIECRKIENIVFGGSRKVDGRISPTLQLQKFHVLHFENVQEFTQFINKCTKLKNDIIARACQNIHSDNKLF